MGRKTKQIQKEPKEDKPQAASKKEKNTSAASSDWDIFTDSFKERLAQFIALNTEVLDLKAAVEGSDQSEEINKRKEHMAGKIEEAAADILKNEVSSLQQWVKDQQKTLQEDIKKIETAYEDTRANLLSTGAFSEEEVKNQLTAVQKKAQDKKDVYDNYEELLNKSKSIYN